MRVEADGYEMIDYYLFVEDNGIFYIVRCRKGGKKLWKRKFLRENKHQLQIRTVRDEIAEVMTTGTIMDTEGIDELVARLEEMK